MSKMMKPQQQFNLTRLSLTKQARMRVMLTVAFCMAFNQAQALPTGEQVQAGNIGFVRDAQSLNINQTSQQAIVNWQSFGIAANEAVRLYQPNQGIALFRVVGSDPSQIFGSLSATGGLFLSNPNGVLFAPGAQVNVGSLLATTMQISDQDFLARHYQFNGDSNAAVINQGVIRAEDGGYIALLGNAVENSGTLQANNGSVVLGAAQSALLDIYGDGLVRVKLSGDALNAAIKNTGNITADGGAVQLATSARTAALNVNGVVQANSLVERNGVVRLEGGKNSTVQVSGNISAKGNITGLKGGEVNITGERVALLDDASVDVSGRAGGGTALIGGDVQGKNANFQNAERTYIASTATIKADALDSGDGGKVVVWANDIARYYGSISAKGGANGGNGGFAEVSGKRLLNFLGNVDLSATQGVGGNLLLDPLNITISTGADTNTTGFTPPGDITEAFADDAGLNSIFRVNAGGSFAGITAGSTITLQATNNITVANAFNLATATGSANNSLVLEANNNITVNAGATVTASGTGSVTMRADADNSGAGAVALNAGIVTAGGTVTLSGATMSSNAAGAINSAGGAVNLSTSTGTSTLSGVISGAGTSINKNGAGTVNLTGANTYTGATNINQGTLGVSGGAIPNASAVNVAAGATFSVNAADIIGSLAGAGNVILTGNLTTGGDNTSTTFSGVMSGAGGLAKAGTGSMALSGANTYTGTTTVSAGTLVAANNTALGGTGAGTTVANGATLALQGGISVGAEVLSINGAGVGANGALRNLSGNNSFAGTVTLAGNAEIQSDAGVLTLSAANSVTGATRTLTVDGAGNTTINGTITTTTGGLTKNNTGVLTLSGANTYTGATTINAGTLRYGANNAIATGGVTVNNGGTYDLNGFSDTIGALAVNSGATGGSVTTGAGTLTLGGNITSTGGAGNALISGNLNLGAAARTVAVTNAADGLAISAVVSGGVGLTKAGNGAVTLAGANTYTGATAVNAGTLVAAHANALGTTATGTTVATGATLNVNNVTLANEAITINGTGVGGAGALTGTGAAAAGGNVTTASNSSIGTASVASSLSLNGVVTAANNLGIVGTGDVTATNASNNLTTVNINGAKNVSLRDVNAITLGNGVSSLTGNLTVRAGGNVTVANNIATTGGDITLAGINFINAAGVSALSASGRWLVYANTHTGNTFGGLNSANQAVWGTAFPAAVSQTGNRYVFANSPALTVTSTNQSKTYGQDGAPTVANAYTASGFINAATFGNVFTQDIAVNSLSGSATSTGSPTTANVGSYAISVAPITATTGYTLTKNSTGLLTVNPATLTVTASNQTKTYGQTFNFAGTEFTSSGLQNGETIGSATLTSAGAVNTANVAGSPYAVSASAATGGTFNATNYNINYINGAMTVGPAAINLNGTRTYNGTTAFNAGDFGTVSGVLGQTLNLSGAGSVASANAGAAQAVSLGSLALADGSGLAANYTLTGGTHTGTINQADLTIGTGNVVKTYDGTLAAAGTAIVTSGSLFNNASNGGVLDSLSGGTFAYTDANAGAGNKTVTVAGVTVSDGNAGGNYNVTYVNNTTSTINKANLTVSTTDVVKTYDGTTTAAGTATVTSGILFNNASNGGVLDNLSGGTFAFADKNFGIGNKTVTVSGVTVNDGNGGGNYAVTFADNTTSTINKASLTLDAASDTRTYNGLTDSAGLVTFSGLQLGDALSGLTQSFDSKNAGSRTLTVDAGYVLNDGNGGNNYNVTTNAAAGTITPRAITVTANPGQSKVAGNADPLPFTFTIGGLGLVGSDTLTGALSRIAGEAVGSYAINQGSLDAGSNYALSYIGNNFTILAAPTVPAPNSGASGNPRNAAGLVDLNPMLNNYTNQQLFVLNVGFTAAGNDSAGNQQACEEDPEVLAKDKDFILMLNYGLKLPKGVNTSCDKASI